MPKLHWRHVGVRDGVFSEEQSALDHAAIERLHQQQEKALGCRVDRMDLTKPPVMVAYVCEVDGVIDGGVYMEAVGEMCFLGTNPIVTASAKRVMTPVLVRSMRQRGIRWVRAFIPKVAFSEKFKTLADRLMKPLSQIGFVDQDKALKHFSLDLRERPARREPSLDEGHESEDSAAHCALSGVVSSTGQKAE
jgi:hypothetical protein